jgi:hypothetical protein
MTVNERLFACGMFPRWDAAVLGIKRDEMISLLCQVAFTREQAENTADAVLGDSPET